MDAPRSDALEENAEGWEASSHVDAGDDDWPVVEHGSWATPDARTRTWPLAGPEPAESPSETDRREGIRIAAAVAPVTLLLFPRDDPEFAAHCQEVAHATRDPHTAQRRLRRRYPRAVVHPRDPLGSLDRRDEAWYVYRNGAPGSQAS
jgi:hypothetical protein